MLGNALTFPKDRDDWLKTVGIGAALLSVSILIIPYFVLLGYSLEVIQSGVNDESQPPVFDEWLDRFIDGLTLFGIQILYGIVGFGVPVAIIGMTLPEVLQAPLSPDQPVTPHLSTAEGTVVLLAYLFAFLALYVSLAATARFAHEDRFEAAFEMRSIVRIAFSSEFFIGFVLFLSVCSIPGTIIGILFLVIMAILGTFNAVVFLVIFGLVPLFYVYVIAYYLIGWGYKRAINRHGQNDTLPVRHSTS
jgi:magnesium-transporting ATPase (P-type)